jgi:demethylmenaquinone methyltransferase / 2-methoxy-6-polyprenyl-1,4-benzoquinol methylase
MRDKTALQDDARTAKTHFGFASITLDEKQPLVDAVFHKVAERYDIMNDVMSFGLHREWKDALVAMLRPNPAHDFRHLDVAGGTGDVAFRIRAAGGEKTKVTMLDINGEMLSVGRERALRQFGEGVIDVLQGNAESLPFEDHRFDGLSIAFGIRNVPRIAVALGEFYRVLKRGGRLLVLEFAPVDMPVLDRLYEAYSFTAIPAFGKVITGDGQPYRYLVESIQRFPRPDAFARMISAAGFGRVTIRPLTGGVVNIHSAWKL